jgi:hypothetical protein
MSAKKKGPHAPKRPAPSIRPEEEGRRFCGGGSSGAAAAGAAAEEDVEDADVYFVFLDSLEAEDTFFDFSRLHEAVASPSVGRYTLATLLGLLALGLSLVSGAWVGGSMAGCECGCASFVCLSRLSLYLVANKVDGSKQRLVLAEEEKDNGECCCALAIHLPFCPAVFDSFFLCSLRSPKSSPS